MKNRLISFNFISKLVFLVAVVGVIMVIYDQQSQNLTSETMLFKKSTLEPTKLFYTEYNKKCMKACEDAGGVSCGKVNKNCCQKRSCYEKIVGDYCYQYIAIIGCTSPS